jgi:hypothetical protein
VTGRGATSSRTVLIGFFALIALAVGIFIVVYLRLLGYDRVAARHIPERTDFVARLDLRQVILFAPIREHVVPVLVGPTSDASDLEERLKELQVATGVNLGMDVFEVVVLSSEGEFGAVIGGRMPSSGVVEGVFRLLKEAPERACEAKGPRLSCRLPAFAMQQAEDGVVVVASTETLLERMLPQGNAYVGLGIDPNGAANATLVLHDTSWGAAPLLFRGAGAAELGQMERLEARVDLGDPVKLHFEAVPRAGASLAALAPKLESWRPLLQGALAFGPGSDFAGERAVLSRLRFGARGDRATAEAEWQLSEIDQAARSLGAILGAWLGGPTK